MKLPLLVRSILVATCIAFAVAAQDADSLDTATTISKSDTEFFETHIRPLLVDKCYDCHSVNADPVEGNLLLDSRPAIAAGGSSGKVINGTDPNQSLLIQAVRWTDSSLQMPPDGRLSPQQIAVLEQWVSRGAPDPREVSLEKANRETREIDIQAGREWWAFQPLRLADVPESGSLDHNQVEATSTSWPQKRIDYFVIAKLAQQQLSPSPAADRDVLIRRAYLDLTGLRPTFEQVQAFVNDDSPDAYARLVEQLLHSPHYGERWGRYWLDVVRYGEDNFTGEATTPSFPFAWRYRDWVINAINTDLPYDRFVKLQLAADLMPNVERKDMVALGFLGAAPSYHKDGRLSKEVVETLYTDDWDERIDTVSRGLLGLTVACARCHDHKFDPITMSDYYSLASVFASTVQAPRPLAKIDAAAETKFMVDAQRVFYFSYAARLLRDDPGSKPDEAREKVIRFRAEMEQIKQENAALQETHPELFRHLVQLAKQPRPYPDEPQIESNEDDEQRGRRRSNSNEPLFQAVYDAGFHVDGSDPDFTMIDIRPSEVRDLDILIGGNVTRPGELAPRGFLAVLAKSDPKFQDGSGRLELAERIFSDAAALSARVIVNRVWAWHFGQPLVATPSDFGSQGAAPTHPELLDDLAYRFVQHGYSWKWLHREIMLSATYRQSSQPQEQAIAIDPANQFLWRMNPRRLDIEAYRDCLLQAAGTLETEMAGPSDDLDRSTRRRTVYGHVRRGRPAALLELYDFPSPKSHSPMRESTTSPLQQLFIMNSDFILEQAESLVENAIRSTEVDLNQPEHVDGSQRNALIIRSLYHRVFGRNPTAEEQRMGEQFLQSGSLTQYAQALLATNEVIFWP
ncbi:MAG: PSD1 and planctomycete cytochrome C domain-containing protein [Pirellulaceae bacterium]